MWRLARVSILILILVAVPVLATDEADQLAEPRLLLVEFMTASSTSAGDEFVEIYNDSDQLVPADELKLQYKSVAGEDWQTNTALSGALQPRGRYLISTSGLVESTDVERASLGLAASGGHLRLIKESSDKFEYDQIAWGTAEFPQAEAMVAPEKDQSMKRKLNEDGIFLDTNDDSADFMVSVTPSPQPAQPLATNSDDSNSTEIGQSSKNRIYSDSTSGNKQVKAVRSGPFAPISISELMINPDKPLTDAEDEFVELFNPNKMAVDLEDYRLETGLTYSYGFTLPDISIQAGEYLVFYSLDTNLTLANGGGQARLLDPTGKVIFEVPPYDKAKANSAWALLADTWQWTSQPTPGEPNVAATANSGSGASGGTSSSDSLASSARQGFNDSRNVYEEPPALNSDEMDKTVVAGVGSLALLYAGYEYRFDIGNRFNQLKRYLESRRTGGPSA